MNGERVGGEWIEITYKIRILFDQPCLTKKGVYWSAVYKGIRIAKIYAADMPELTRSAIDPGFLSKHDLIQLKIGCDDDGMVRFFMKKT